MTSSQWIAGRYRTLLAGRDADVTLNGFLDDLWNKHRVI
jgi:hypothetical protein